MVGSQRSPRPGEERARDRGTGTACCRRSPAPGGTAGRARRPPGAGPGAPFCSGGARRATVAGPSRAPGRSLATREATSRIAPGLRRPPPTESPAPMSPAAESAPEPTETADPGPVVIIGAGPAGLTAAYALGKAGHTATVLEATDVVGGISQTVVRDGYRFDIGGHRFFTKVARGRGALARDPPGRGLPPAPPLEPHLLPGQVLRLPAQGVQRAPHARPGRGGPLRAVLPLGARPAAEGPVHARGLRRRQLRLAPVRPLLRGVQHQGVGRPALGDLGRVGRAAHQGDDAVDRGVGAVPRQARRQARARASRSRASSRSSSTRSTAPG